MEILKSKPSAIEQRLLDSIGDLSRQIAELEGRHEGLGLADQVVDLRRQISDLEIEKGKKEEEHDRREREVTHKVGLEKKRAEFERVSAVREAKLEVREESLEAKQERFEQEMQFQRERFESEVGYLKDILGEILERLPTVTIDKQTGRK